MTAPIFATDKGLLIVQLAEIAGRLNAAGEDTLRYHYRNPASIDTLPALVHQVDELCIELAQWRVRATGGTGA